MLEGLGSVKISRADFPQTTRFSAPSDQEVELSEKSADGDVQIRAEQVKAVAEKLNRQIERINGKFSISVDDHTGRIVARIVDTRTGETVKQIPPQQVLDVSVSMEKIIGLLINDKI